MRICYISHGSFPHIRAYLDYFSQAGHEVHFLSLAPGPDFGVPTYKLGFGKYSRESGKWKYLLSMPKARILIKKIKPDIIHAHYATSGGLTAWFSGFHPTVITVHGSDLTANMQSRIWRSLLKRIFYFADCVNVVSDNLKQMAVELGVAKEKLCVIPVGIETRKFVFVPRNLPLHGRPLKIICTRRLETVYDHPTILRALAICKRNGIDFKMTFIGGGPLEKELKGMSERLTINQNVDFLGQMENSRIPHLLAEHDVYLSASLWDGTSLCLLEAMATGIYPIVSDIPANSAWIQNGHNGLLHRLKSPEDLSERINIFIQNLSWAIDSAQINRLLVEQRGDRQTNMKLLEQKFMELVNK